MGCAPSSNKHVTDENGDEVPYKKRGKLKSSTTRQRRLSQSQIENDEKYVLATQNAADPPIAPKRGSHKSSGVTTQQLPEASSATSQPIAFTGAMLSKTGREPGYKKTNQDSCFMHKFFAQTGQSLFGCFDGHGPNGHWVSAFVKEQIPVILAEKLAQPNADPVSALRNTFLEVDRALGTCGSDVSFSGSTGVVTLLQGRRLTCAWVGDSRCVLGRRAANGRITTLAMTTDHKPSVASERQRIEAAGGRVQRLMGPGGQLVGPQRVWLKSAWIPGLAMSRALGDVVAHQVGVISDPDVCQYDLTPEDEFLVLATDGVWEFLTNEQAVQIVSACSNPDVAAKKLVDRAHARWIAEEAGVIDDISVVIVKWKKQP